MFILFNSYTRMPPKRKRVVIPSEERSPKNLPQSHLTLQSIPDDCLSEILSHLPPISLCAASLTSSRFNNVFQGFKLEDLSKKFGFSNKAINNMPESIKTLFYPRGQYLAFEQLISLATEGDDENLEKLLNRLNNWLVLKISEKLNNLKLKDHLNEDILKIINSKVAYKELSPEESFDLWSYTDSNTNGGKFHVSFYLFGVKEHFVEVNCDVFSYYEHSGGTFTCDITLNAKLMGGTSKKVTEVKGLLEGYKECEVPEFYSDDENEDEDEDEDEDNECSDEEEIFRKEVKRGERVKREWWHDCYPKLNSKKLDQVKKWLGWDMTTKEFAQVLVTLSMNPSRDEYEKDIDTSDTKASLETILRLLLTEEDQWLNQVERTLDLVHAKIKLKNRIRKDWKKKAKAKLNQALSLIDRSMYTKWSLTRGLYDPDPEFIIHAKEVRGELKLIAEDPSNWVTFNFEILLCREDDPNSRGDDDNIKYSISTSRAVGEQHDLAWKDWTVAESDVKRIQEELGISNFTAKEVLELLAMAADHQLDQISLERNEKSK